MQHGGHQETEDQGRSNRHDAELKPPRPIVHDYPLIDELLDARRSVFGGTDQEGVFRGYRNHVYHILNFARQWIDPSPERDDKVAIAAVFHDIAAWPNGNIDYLRPSADQADQYLDQIGRSAWKPEMRLMIESHHKITAYGGTHSEWVEPVRRADWCDVSFATMRFGLPKSFVNEVRSEFPLAPFYPGFVYKAISKWALLHPLSPVPILRW
ncbi:MAG: hypothetical protein L0H29_07290 [Sinobacteraceae bacterium]|nr:hypothetical protein [Nevskiaceae bacterium]